VYIYSSGQPYTYGIFSREITIYTVIYGVYVRFWPTLHIRYFWQQNHYIFGHIWCRYTVYGHPRVCQVIAVLLLTHFIKSAVLNMNSIANKVFLFGGLQTLCHRLASSVRWLQSLGPSCSEAWHQLSGTWVYTCVYTHTHIPHTYHTHTHTHAHTHKYKHMLTHPHADTHTHAHTHKYTHMHTHPHADTHTCTHTRTHTYAHTHKHTHTGPGMTASWMCAWPTTVRCSTSGNVGSNATSTLGRQRRWRCVRCGMRVCVCEYALCV
jgi:hypothetical protein